jgi:hypothetical protein
LNEMRDSVHSPCVRNCCLDDNDICLGCFRSMHEIIHWSESSAEERLNIISNAKERRVTHDHTYGRISKNTDLES